MVQDLKAEMLNVQRENLQLYGAVRELSSILALAGRCAFYDSCPIHDELQSTERLRNFGKGVNVGSDHAKGEDCLSELDASDGQPFGAAGL